MYVVQVDQNTLRARSDPMPAITALKVAKAWQSHGDRGVRIVEAGTDASDRSWTIRDFIAFSKQTPAQKLRIPRLTEDAMIADIIEAAAGA